MTYVPVDNTARKNASGRKQTPIPAALVAQLQHSAATGAHCEIDLSDLTDEERAGLAEEIKELKRALIRAGYRLFPDKTINKRFGATLISYWVSPKQKNGAK